MIREAVFNATIRAASLLLEHDRNCSVNYLRPLLHNLTRATKQMMKKMNSSPGSIRAPTPLQVQSVAPKPMLTTTPIPSQRATPSSRHVPGAPTQTSSTTEFRSEVRRPSVSACAQEAQPSRPLADTPSSLQLPSTEKPAPALHDVDDLSPRDSGTPAGASDPIAVAPYSGTTLSGIAGPADAHCELQSNGISSCTQQDVEKAIPPEPLVPAAELAEEISTAVVMNTPAHSDFPNPGGNSAIEPSASLETLPRRSIVDSHKRLPAQVWLGHSCSFFVLRVHSSCLANHSSQAAHTRASKKFLKKFSKIKGKKKHLQE